MTYAGEFGIAARSIGSNEVIELRGELDLAGVPALRSQITTTVRERDPDRLILDLTDLEFIDSTGLAVLVWAHRLLAGRGKLLGLVAPRLHVQRVLRVTGLNDVVHVHPTLEDALAAPLPLEDA